jgi:hypothetical protein
LQEFKGLWRCTILKHQFLFLRVKLVSDPGRRRELVTNKVRTRNINSLCQIPWTECWSLKEIIQAVLPTKRHLVHLPLMINERHGLARSKETWFVDREEG